jgi:hypothetical protein
MRPTAHAEAVGDPSRQLMSGRGAPSDVSTPISPFPYHLSGMLTMAFPPEMLERMI